MSPPTSLKLFLSLHVFAICFCSNIIAISCLTFRHNHGRLGDVLLNFTKHYYIAERYNLELYIHNEIPYLQNFMLDNEIPRLKHKVT